ncbi:unnamed protein product [Auanema sp. JU1783]|nr:unnamed protein product [Auanema sp. JU1783]
MCDTRKGTSTRKPRLNESVVERQKTMEKLAAQQHDKPERTTSRRKTEEVIVARPSSIRNDSPKPKSSTSRKLSPQPGTSGVEPRQFRTDPSTVRGISTVKTSSSKNTGPIVNAEKPTVVVDSVHSTKVAPTTSTTKTQSTSRIKKAPPKDFVRSYSPNSLMTAHPTSRYIDNVHIMPRKKTRVPDTEVKKKAKEPEVKRIIEIPQKEIELSDFLPAVMQEVVFNRFTKDEGTRKKKKHQERNVKAKVVNGLWIPQLSKSSKQPSNETNFVNGFLSLVFKDLQKEKKEKRKKQKKQKLTKEVRKDNRIIEKLIGKDHGVDKLAVGEMFDAMPLCCDVVSLNYLLEKKTAAEEEKEMKKAKINRMIAAKKKSIKGTKLKKGLKKIKSGKEQKIKKEEQSEALSKTTRCKKKTALGRGTKKIKPSNSRIGKITKPDETDDLRASKSSSDQVKTRQEKRPELDPKTQLKLTGKKSKQNSDKKIKKSSEKRSTLRSDDQVMKKTVKKPATSSKNLSIRAVSVKKQRLSSDKAVKMLTNKCSDLDSEQKTENRSGRKLKKNSKAQLERTSQKRIKQHPDHKLKKRSKGTEKTVSKVESSAT